MENHVNYNKLEMLEYQISDKDNKRFWVGKRIINGEREDGFLNVRPE